MGVAFEDAAIHEGAGIALVAIANDVLAFTLRLGDRRPLQTCGIAAAAPAAQAALNDRLKNLSGLHVLNGALERTISSGLDIVLYPLGIDAAAPGSHHGAFVGRKRVA